MSIASDPEAQASTVSVMRTYPTPPQGRVSDYRRDLVRQLMFQMLNVRFGDMARRPDAPFLGAGASQQPVTAMTSAVSLGARVEDGKIEQGLHAVILEARRARELGFSPSEFEQVRRRVLAAYEQALAERDKTDSGNYAAEYIRNFTTDEPFPGIQTEYDLTRALLPGITQDEVSEVARDLLAEDNRAVLVAAPEKAAAPLPAEAALRQVLDRSRRRDGGAVENVHVTRRADAGQAGRRPRRLAADARRHRRHGPHAVERRGGLAEAHRLQERPGAADAATRAAARRPRPTPATSTRRSARRW